MSYEGNETFLLLGGGMVGRQAAYETASTLRPERSIISALTQAEADGAAERLKAESPDAEVRAVAGNVFVRREWSPSSGRESVGTAVSAGSEERRASLYEDIFGRTEEADRHSELVWLIEDFNDGDGFGYRIK